MCCFLDFVLLGLFEYGGLRICCVMGDLLILVDGIFIGIGIWFLVEL